MVEKKPTAATGSKKTSVAKSKPKKGVMSVQEAGRKGGNTVKQKYGPEFYAKIGQKGGEVRGKEIHEAAEYFRNNPLNV